MKFRRFWFVLISFVCLSGPSWAQDPSSWGQAGEDFLLQGATIVVSPGKTLKQADLHVVKGRIAAVGSSLSGNPGSRKIDLSGLVIHPGFIDPYVPGSKLGLKKNDKAEPQPDSGGHPRVHDDFRVVDTLSPKKKDLAKYREEGFVALAVVPEGGLLRGQAAVYSTGESKSPAELVLKPDAYSVVGFETRGWGQLKGENYPLSLMGCTALIRQTFLDRDWYEKARTVAGFVDKKPDYQANLESLKAVVNGERLLVGQSKDYLDVLRILTMFKEIGLPRTALLLSGEEWKELSWFKNSISPSQSFILPLKFPKDPKAEDGVAEEDLTLELLRSWYFAPANPRWLKEKGVRFSFTAFGQKGVDDLEGKVAEAVAAGLSKTDALAALTTEPARLLGVSDELGTLEVGKSASFVVREGEPFGDSTAIREVWVEGQRFPDYVALAKSENPEAEKPKVRDFIKKSNYSSPPTLFSQAHSPSSVLIKGATLWSQEGNPASGDLLVRGGKIVSVGPSGSAAEVIDGTGLHLTPGIVDAHSHTAVDGMVNEPGANVTAMVRMKDVLDPFDHNIYLQLASGVTTVNILHGSANAIGGQSVTCKWRYGASSEGLVMNSAPGGIKFALGENPKQSNWGDAHATRYPQSRMGVVELIRGSFVTARNYLKLKEAGKNPRPDQSLDALVDVLKGTRIVHCHSYRQDEILALIRVAEEVGIKINVFQHVLEGYKIADKLKEHGAAASTFADWWAYKVEVDDAIPYNASLMTEVGVNVSINSDSNDLARRLNTEASKSLRYGGMSEVQALNMITRNGAEQLGVGDQIGTLKAGKDADFVIWNDNPLKQNAVVLETWIDGKRYFQRSQEAGRVKALEAERESYLKLLEKDDKEDDK